MAANIFSSASWHKSANVRRFAGTKQLRSLRRMNVARRWRSDAAAKPHQALEACINLATTTVQKIVCSETSSMPGAQDSESIQSLRARTDNSVNMLSDRKTVRKGDTEDFEGSNTRNASKWHSGC